MTESRSLFDLITAAIWLGLATIGIVRRCQRLIRLNRIILPMPLNHSDADYLRSVKQSTYLRLGVKAVFLVGGLIALFGLPLFEVWRTGVILALIFMDLETVSVDAVRERLGRVKEADG